MPYLYHIADLGLPFDGSRDPLSIVTNAAAEYAPIFDMGRLPAFIQRTFKDGQALLLIDGFDELDPAGQKHAIAWFKALLQAYPAIRIVTTGSPTQLNGLISLGFSPLPLIAWDARATSQFIKQWGELWSRTVSLEASSSSAADVEPILLNSWIGAEEHGTPFSRASPTPSVPSRNTSP